MFQAGDASIGARVNDLVLTGLPRSGTTLLAALLHAPPQSVVVHEPAWQGAWLAETRGSPTAFAARLAVDFRDVRAALAEGHPLPLRESIDGQPLTNYVARRSGRVEASWRVIERSYGTLVPGFTLAMKGPALYTAVLPALVSSGVARVVALVRHPVATLLSWRAVPFPIAEGRLPAAEPYWPELAAVACSPRPVLERQAAIWELFVRRYLDCGTRLTLLRYEDVVDRPGDVASRLGLETGTAGVPVERGLNQNPAYDLGAVGAIRDALAASSPTALALYGPDLGFPGP